MHQQLNTLASPPTTTLLQPIVFFFRFCKRKNGKQLKQLNLSGAGKGTIYVDASTLAFGAYNYSLYVDGKFVASKQMELLK